MSERPIRIAMIAHDLKKHDLVKLAELNASILSSPKIAITATGTTGKLIENALRNQEKTKIFKIQMMQSGPLGGDAQIGAKIVENEIDYMIFIVDPLYAHPHEPDITALLRLCNVYNVPTATNISTAKLLLKHIRDTHFSNATFQAKL